MVMDDVSPPGFAALHVPRPTTVDGPSRGGGLSIVHRESVVVRRHPLSDDIHPSTFELQLIRIGSPPSVVHAVFHIYRPQWMSSVPAFVDELADIIALFGASCTDSFIVCGDLNCPGADGTRVDELLAIALDSFGLLQHVNLPTRHDNLLDILASSDPSVVTGVGVDDAGLISDHRLVTARLAVHRVKQKIAYTSRNIRAIDSAVFEQKLLESSARRCSPRRLMALMDSLISSPRS